MNIINQITSSWESAAGLTKVAIVVASCLMLFVALKVGRFFLKLILGLVGLGLLGGAIWWFFVRH